MKPTEGLQAVELLNLSKGLVLGSLIDEILEKRASNTASNGVNLEENRRKRVEIKKNISSARRRSVAAQ